MPQQKQLTWTELRVGIFVLVGLLLIAVAIFYVTGSGSLGAKYRLHTFLPEVDGLAIGAPVSLDGVQVGNVETILIAPATPGQPFDKDRSIEVIMRVSRKYQTDIRSDSQATLVTEGLLGDRYVDIARGSSGVALTDGQEVPGAEETAIKQVVERSADVMANLSALSQQVGEMVNDLKHGQGTLGALLTDKTLYNNLNSTVNRANDMMAGLQNGQGTLGKLVTSDELYTKVNSSTGRLDDILAAIQQQKGSIGKLVYDPSVHDEAKEFLHNADGLLAGIRAGQGTLGKLATDDTLYTEYRDIGKNLTTATAKLDSNEGTAGKLFNDPQFYDNVTGLAGDMRLLIGDFEKNPKKFLTIKLNVF
ncbi:MAG: MlaD family protein [Candidatus Acidiferrales bacterium]|jgi:phospholipid/cholesterol/gamma-HCH transport system substrate-binding protein